MERLLVEFVFKKNPCGIVIFWPGRAGGGHAAVETRRYAYCMCTGSMCARGRDWCWLGPPRPGAMGTVGGEGVVRLARSRCVNDSKPW